MLVRAGLLRKVFPISRDPPEGGTSIPIREDTMHIISFQFLGIPPKGERCCLFPDKGGLYVRFQVLGIPPKGELIPCYCGDPGCFQVSNF